MPIVNNIRAEFIPVNFEKPAILKQKTIQANGVYNASDDNADGFSSVTVVVPAPNIQELNITPSIEPQTIIVQGTIEGYGPVNVSGVENVLPGNIKEGVSILGVEGNVKPAPNYYVEKTNNNGTLKNSAPLINLTGITDIDAHVLAYEYYSCKELTSIDFSSLTTISGSGGCYSTFYNCTELTSVDLSSLTSIKGDDGCWGMFVNCRGLTSIDLSSLTTVSGSQGCYGMFSTCTSLTSIDLSSLTTMFSINACANMFGYCTGLTSIDLSSLTIVNSGACYRMFQSCTGLTRLDFPALTSTSFGNYTNQFNNMLREVTGCTVHFPSNLQSVIGSWGDVTSGFGGTNTTVLFDLPATVILTGANTTEYQRSPKDDTQTALAWRVKDGGTTADPVIDWTPFYTNGTTDPQAGDTLYSDAECTTAVTTIDSIA